LSTERFYADLPEFREFAEFTDLESYAPLPDDWTVLASDVVGSTIAIEQGRYKQVNMSGAATIMAVINAADGVDLPYVFGGDGAVIAAPPVVAEACKTALARAASMIAAIYDLELRVAAFPASDLRARGGDILVRKFGLGPGARLAMFAGDGLELADVLLKDEDEGARYRIPLDDQSPDLDGLTCRWEPLAPSHGVMATIMVKGLGSGESGELRYTLDEIQRILGGDAAEAAPTSNRTLSFRFPPRGLKLEALAFNAFTPFKARFWRIIMESLVQLYAERFQKQVGPYNAPEYRKEMVSQTDFRKYDGMLRMVLDLTLEQADALEAVLEQERVAGRLVYGFHRSDSALMTCLVFDLTSAAHVHFIDGADGGFALAARQLKEQIAG
jgi:hypothetical protein